MRVRAARPETDGPAAAAIYGPHVDGGHVSFEEAPPDAAEMARRMAATLADGCSWLVAEEAGAVPGHAYAGPFRPRGACRRTVETAV